MNSHGRTTSGQRPHVLILGAGIAGLTLAQSLRKKGISFEIFERDERIDSRSGGWAIAIHTILERLKQSLPDDVPDLDGTNHLLPLKLPAQICFYGGPKKASVESSQQHPILRARRQQLRETLATNLRVHWGTRVAKIEQGPEGVVLTLKDGSTASGDFLVGADGVTSVVRSHLCKDTELSTLPAGVINGEPTLDMVRFERQLSLAHSAYVAGGPGYHLYVGLSSVLPNGAGAKYYWYLNFYDPKASKEPYWTVNATQEEMLAFAVDKVKELHPTLAQVVHLTRKEDIRVQPIVFRDLELTKIPEGRITLIGDAAHPMAPFRGEGGSHALEDALNLAEVFEKVTAGGDFLELKMKYEDEMLPRGRHAVERSRAVLEPEKGADMSFAWGQRLKFEDLPDDLL